MKHTRFEKKVWLATPTMHGEELNYLQEAYHTNWMTTIGKNIDEIEQQAAALLGCSYAIALASGTAAIHLAVKLAGIQPGDVVLCSDTTFSATVNPVLYEGGVPVFIDSEYDTWNMDPAALEKAFAYYPNAKAVIVANLYGTPAKLNEIQNICKKYNAVLIEDAAESMGALYKNQQTGSFGEYGILSFNGNKIITGSSGGMLLTQSKAAYEKVRKWSTQSRENAPWYQHEEAGYNYRMSNVIAGVVRGQLPYLAEHIARKKKIYLRYQEGFRNLPVTMNPFVSDSEPNYWLSCMLIEKSAMCRQVRSDTQALYQKEPGKSCPTEILEKLQENNAEGRPIWKPMHMQPIFRMHPYITKSGLCRAMTNAYLQGEAYSNVGEDLFARGLCLPSDIKMTKEEQDRIIALIVSCFA